MILCSIEVMDFDKWIAYGKQLGLEGAELRQWVKEQQEQAQALAREERALAREEKEKEREREEKHRKRMQVLNEECERLKREWERLERERDRKQRSDESVDVAHERCEEQSSAVQFRAAEKASTSEGSSMFKNEPRLEAAKDAALRGEAAEDHCKRDEVLCQWNATETANTVVENLAQTPSECVAALDLACGVQGEFDPLGKNARARSGDGAKVQSTDYNAVVDSSQARDLGCFSEESSCIVPKRVKLSASLPGKEDDDLFVSHLDCAGEKANESFEKVDEHQLQAGCSKVSPKKRHRRKRRRRARRAAKSTTRVKKGSKRWSIVAGVRRLSSLTRLFSTRLRRQTKRKRKAGFCANAASGKGSALPPFYPRHV